MNYKQQYMIAENVIYAAKSLMDRATPATTDAEAWKLWDEAWAALDRYAAHLRSKPFNPVVQEAHVRGDFSHYADQLERGNPEYRKRKGFTKKQIRKAIPIIRKLAEEAEGENKTPELFTSENSPGVASWVEVLRQEGEDGS